MCLFIYLLKHLDFDEFQIFEFEIFISNIKRKYKIKQCLKNLGKIKTNEPQKCIYIILCCWHTIICAKRSRKK